jgi:Lon protease-like protein
MEGTNVIVINLQNNSKSSSTSNNNNNNMNNNNDELTSTTNEQPLPLLIKENNSSNPTTTTTTITPSLLTTLRTILECGICMQLLSDPLTLPCGHTFCASCLIQMSHSANSNSITSSSSSACPFCRAPILSISSRKPSILLERVIGLVFPQESKQVQIDKNQSSNSNSSSPPVTLPSTIGLFILGSDFCRGPGMTITLRVFEPRYLLLMQNSITHDSQFGICAGREARKGVLARIGRAQNTWGGEMLVEARIDDRFEFDEIILAQDSDVGLRVARGCRMIVDVDDNNTSTSITTTPTPTIDVLGRRVHELITQIIDHDLSASERLLLERRNARPPVLLTTTSISTSTYSYLSFWLVATLKWKNIHKRDDVLFSTSLRYRLISCLEILEEYNRARQNNNRRTINPASSLFVDLGGTSPVDGLLDVNVKGLFIFGALLALVFLTGNSNTGTNHHQTGLHR